MDEPTKDELYEQAQEADIEGRSSMTKTDLIEALGEAAVEAPQRQPRTGAYVVQRGDHPARVADTVWGDASRGREIAIANPDADWSEGSELHIPT